MMLTEETRAAMRVGDCLPQPPAPTDRTEEPRGVSTGGVSMGGVSVSGDFMSAEPVSMPWGGCERVDVRGWR